MDSIDKLEAENGGQVLNQLVVQLSEENGIRKLSNPNFLHQWVKYTTVNLQKKIKKCGMHLY